MEHGNQDTRTSRKKQSLSSFERLHPYKTMLFLTIGGICLLFAILLTGYSLSYKGDQVIQNTDLPGYFIVSTAIMLISSMVISYSLRYFDADQLTGLIKILGVTLCMGIAFIVFQYLSWSQLKNRGVFLTTGIAGAYLYIISGLHLLHFIGGMVFMIIELYKLANVIRDPVKSLIFSTDPFEKLKLELLITYWHFMDILWLILFLFFILTW